MAITRHSLSQANTTLTDTETSLTTSVTVPAGDDRLIVVVTGQESNAAGAHQIGSVAFGGVGLSQLAEAGGADWSHAEIWYLKAPAVSTANVVTTFTNADNVKHGIYVFDGVDQITTFRTAQTGAGTAIIANETVPGVVSTDYLVDVIAIDGTGHSAASDQTTEYATEVTGVTVCSSTMLGSVGAIMAWGWSGSAAYSHVATALIATPPTLQTVHPDADVTTTGWTATPLWSKVEETSPDGTVITATAS